MKRRERYLLFMRVNGAISVPCDCGGGFAPEGGVTYAGNRVGLGALLAYRDPPHEPICMYCMKSFPDDLVAVPGRERVFEPITWVTQSYLVP